jgi:AraC-like DNA-binding protein
MPKNATIISGALNGLQDVLVRNGRDPAALGQQSGVPVDAWRSPQYEIPLFAFVEVYEHGATMLDQPNIGWKSGSSFEFRNLGELGHAVLSASTVGSALRTFERYLRFVQSESEIQMCVEDGVVTLTYRILNPDIWPRRQDAEFTLSVLMELIRRGAGSSWQPDLICLEHTAIRPVGNYADTTGSFCLFDCETNALSFPESVLDSPMPRDDLDRHREAVESLSQGLATKSWAQPLTMRTRTAIYEGLGTGTADQETIARQLGLSRRSLHRHLNGEGARFSALLDECRFRVARHALLDTSQPLAQIAFELDYSDQTAFERAFKRRTGMTPKQYRQSYRKTGQPIGCNA